MLPALPGSLSKRFESLDVSIWTSRKIGIDVPIENPAFKIDGKSKRLICIREHNLETAILRASSGLYDLKNARSLDSCGETGEDSFESNSSLCRSRTDLEDARARARVRLNWSVTRRDVAASNIPASISSQTAKHT